MKLPSCLEKASFLCKKAKYVSSQLRESVTKAGEPRRGLRGRSGWSRGLARTYSPTHSHLCPERPVCSSLSFANTCPPEPPPGWGTTYKPESQAERVPVVLRGAGAGKAQLGGIWAGFLEVVSGG